MHALALVLTVLTAGAPCDSVSEMKVLPFRVDEGGRDAAYDRLMATGCPVVPCLVDRIADATPMADPRQAPLHRGFTVGDAALFVAARITGRSYEESLPSAVRAKVRDEGVGAYFGFVEDRRNRSAIQADWRKWLAAHPSCRAGKDAGASSGICPDEISVEQRLAAPMEGWEVGRSKGRAGLERVTFYDGHPSELASLVPDGEERRGAGRTAAVWKLDPSKAFWVECGYRATDVVILRRLPERTRRCEVVGDSRFLLNGRAPIVDVRCE